MPIRLHFTTLIILFILMTNGYPIYIAIPFTALLLLSVALHEIGHTLIALRYKIPVRSILLTPLGGVATLQGLPENPRHETRIALGGPAVSLILFGIGAALVFLSVSAVGGLLANWFFVFAGINLSLLLFNLLPCFPMDGGRVLRSVLTRKKGALEATRISAEVAKYFAIAFIVLGFFPTVSWTLSLIGVYMLYASKAEYGMMQMKSRQGFAGAASTADANFTASPPPYATRKVSRVPDGLLGDVILTFRDLYIEIGSFATPSRSTDAS